MHNLFKDLALEIMAISAADIGAIGVTALVAGAVFCTVMHFADKK